MVLNHFYFQGKNSWLQHVQQPVSRLGMGWWLKNKPQVQNDHFALCVHFLFPCTFYMNKPYLYPYERGTNNESPTFIIPTILQMEITNLKTNNIRCKDHWSTKAHIMTQWCYKWKYSSETLRKDSFFCPHFGRGA